MINLVSLANNRVQRLRRMTFSLLGILANNPISGSINQKLKMKKKANKRRKGGSVVTLSSFIIIISNHFCKKLIIAVNGGGPLNVNFFMVCSVVVAVKQPMSGFPCNIWLPV